MSNRMLRSLLLPLLLGTLVASTVTMGEASVALGATSVSANPGSAATESRSPGKGLITITVKASPDSVYPSILTLRTPKLYAAIGRAKMRPAIPAETAALLDDTELALRSDQGQEAHFGLLASGEPFDATNNRVLELPSRMQRRLLDAVQTLRAEHYGQALPWEEASRLFPRKKSFMVTDLETGLRFRAERRAGSSHADVQPLTKQDTAIMKRIYSGVWSWNRRAVLVEENGRRVAASMHGMPHGGDGIPGNGFRGHFCIHFLGSVTHGSRSLDLAHQAMANKAAGRLGDFIRKLPPEDVVLLSFIAVNQKDPHLFNGLVLPSLSEKPSWFDARASDVRMVRPISERKDDGVVKDSNEGADRMEVPILATIYRGDHGQERVALRFSLIKRPEDCAWKITAIHSKP